MDQNMTIEEFHLLLTQEQDKEDSQELMIALRRLTTLDDPQEIAAATDHPDLLIWGE